MDSSPTLLSKQTGEMRSAFENLQRSTLRLALPGLLIGSLVIAGSIRAERSIEWAATMALFLLILIPLLWLLNQRSFRAASLILAASLLAAVLSAVLWGGVTPAVCLLFLPVGFLTLTFGVGAGVAAASLVTLALALPLAPFVGIEPELRSVAVISTWSVLGLVWLTLRPLLTAAEWSWEAFQHSQSLLEQARDSRQQLHQALEDLTNANAQLNHLNALANNLRGEAEEERRIKEQFVANVSHELRTPLNMITGFCEMILKAPDAYGGSIPTNLLADLQVVLRNSQHLSSLIDDVLDLSQIEARQMALVKEWVNVEEIAQAAAIAVRPLYESKGLYLEVNVAPGLPVISCDRTRIREVLLNLLSNAGRFTEQGGVRVKAWLDAQNVVFSVADDGPGISEEDRRRLFQPFQQLDPTLRRKHGGTGLGLSISKSFVELHDGSMWVESEKGAGTTFFFRLPVEPAALTETSFTRWMNPYIQYAERPNRTPNLPEVDRRPRVMVVEKGSILQRMLKRYLVNVEVTASPSLEAARADLEQLPANLVLLNEGSACEPGTILRSDLALSTSALPVNTPVIACSIADPVQFAPSPDIPEILVKPISYDTLIGTLEKLPGAVRSVLIVDDERDAQKLFRRMLTAAGKGYQVLRAENGLQALQILRRHQVDVILLDLVMPEMDGFQFLQHKNLDPALCPIPVILISAQDQRGHPIVSNFIAATRSGGISVQQLLDSIQALSGILGPGGPKIGE